MSNLIHVSNFGKNSKNSTFCNFKGYLPLSKCTQKEFVDGKYLKAIVKNFGGWKNFKKLAKEEMEGWTKVIQQNY